MTTRPRLAASEQAMLMHTEGLLVDFRAAAALSNLYRAANAVRNYLTSTVLREHDLTWTGFVVLWVVWIYDDIETRHAAEDLGISKATLTGVVKTLESRGLLSRESDLRDRRLVHLRLTPAGVELMQRLYPSFNAAESRVVSALSASRVDQLTRGLREIVIHLESDEATTAPPAGESVGASQPA